MNESEMLSYANRYTAENSVKYGAPRDTDHPELRQPLALEVWESILKTVDTGSKITLLTNGPLTNLAKLILSNKNASSLIEVSEFIIITTIIMKDNNNITDVKLFAACLYSWRAHQP